MSLLVFIFGAIVGSFLNVVVYRYGTGQSIARGRSKCLACRKTLVWYELVPIISFLALQAKCSSCRTKISWQYFLVELFTGLTFTGIWLAYFPSSSVEVLILLLIAASLLIAIAAYDWRHMIIPDGLVYGFVAVATSRIALVWWQEQDGVGSVLVSLYVALGLFIFFAGLWGISRGAWMGFGDAKLVVGIGLLLGWPFGVSAVVMAFWLGAAIGVVLLAMQKLVHKRQSHKGRRLVTMKTELPFAPFLVLATLATLIFHLNVIPIF